MQQGGKGDEKDVVHAVLSPFFCDVESSGFVSVAIGPVFCGRRLVR